ncbi:MAG: DinB family protein [Bryobacteraceae bacterium]|nr:DinB family protein [Bryobacteraceae bacterium]
MTLPPDLQRVLDGFQANSRTAAELAEHRTADQLAWRPVPAVWSIAECLDHLTRANTAYEATIREAIASSASPKRRGEIQLSWFARWFLSLVEPPPRWKVPAPLRIRPSVHPAQAREALAAFLASQDAAAGLIASGAGLDWNAIRFWSPFGPVRFTIGAGVHIMEAHERRHLLQARRVLESRGFPH